MKNKNPCIRCANGENSAHHNMTKEPQHTATPRAPMTVEDIIWALKRKQLDAKFIVLAVNAYEKDQEIKRELLVSVKELRACLSNWVEIADEDDERQYDDDAIYNADKAIAKAEGK